MAEGKVKWFDSKKGYGFIEASSGEDVFVHFSAVSKNGYKSLKEGDKVSFSITQSQKGFQAADVQIIK